MYDLYFSRLYRLAVHLVYGEEEAKDIVQQLFVDLFEKPVRLEGVRHLGAWLCMAVRNRCLNYLYVQDIEDKRKMLYLEAINEADAPEWLEMCIRDSHPCLLSLGHNPEFPIKGGLKIILGQVLHIGKGQTCKATKDV